MNQNLNQKWMDSVMRELEDMKERIKELEDNQPASKQDHSEMDGKIVSFLGALPSVVRMNGFSIAKSLELDNKAVNGRLRVLVRKGVVERLQEEGEHPVFRIKEQ